jgi:hypothetical protein
VVQKALVVTHRGVSREITMQEALEHRTYQDAIAGKRMAQREVLKWIGKRQAWPAKHGEQPRRPALTVVVSDDPDNADAALLLLGIADHDPARQGLAQQRAQLLLEPWAVEAALRRRRNARLSPKKISPRSDAAHATQTPCDC